VKKPEILLLDEATSGREPKTLNRLLLVFVTFLYVSHKILQFTCRCFIKRWIMKARVLYRQL
jgi:ABC-type molybdenum transport system ATPase subunit/photorepair protein PhrA